MLLSNLIIISLLSFVFICPFVVIAVDSQNTPQTQDAKATTAADNATATDNEAEATDNEAEATDNEAEATDNEAEEEKAAALSNVNPALTYHVKPHENKKITLKNNIEKIHDNSTFSFSLQPKYTDEPLNMTNIKDGVFYYINKLENTTDKIQITEQYGAQARTIDITIQNFLKPLLPWDHNRIIALAVLIAVLVAITLTLVTRYVLNKYKAKFSDIIRGRDMDPSLSYFQFLVWTIVVAFSFVLIYIIRILSGDYTLSRTTIPYNLLVLIGISTAVPIASTVISRAYYERDMTKETNIDDAFLKAAGNKDTAQLDKLRKDNPFGKMLKEDNKPTLGRYQMFIWTFIGVFLYLFSLFGYISAQDQPQEIANLSLPDVDITLVVLMGLSSTAFLGLKTASSWMTIREILPPSTVKPGDEISIFGRNFGEEPNSVWVGTKVVKGTDENFVAWSDERIDIKVPLVEKTGPYDVTVVKKGASIKSPNKILIEVPDAAAAAAIAEVEKTAKEAEAKEQAAKLAKMTADKAKAAAAKEPGNQALKDAADKTAKDADTAQKAAQDAKAKAATTKTAADAATKEQAAKVAKMNADKAKAAAAKEPGNQALKDAADKAAKDADAADKAAQDAKATAAASADKVASADKAATDRKDNNSK